MFAVEREGESDWSTFVAPLGHLLPDRAIASMSLRAEDVGAWLMRFVIEGYLVRLGERAKCWNGIQER